jgi:hypothetical protein
MVIYSFLPSLIKMARMKLVVRKHVHAESHNDGQNASYFTRTLQTVLLALGSSEPCSSLEPQGYFMGTRTFGVYMW